MEEGLKELKRVKEGTELAQALLEDKCKEIEQGLTEAYRIVKGVKFEFGLQDKYCTYAYSDGKDVEISASLEKYKGSLYSIRFEPYITHAGYGDGTDSNQLKLLRVPEARNIAGGCLAKSPGWISGQNIYAPLGMFFEQLLKNYHKQPALFNDILQHINDIPMMLAGGLEKKSFPSFESSLLHIKPGLEDLRDVLEEKVILKMYYDESEVFKKLFGILNEQQQEKLCSWLFNAESNKALNAWISKNYPHLVDKVGRDFVIKAGGEK